jgi:ABC-type multidrug transport system fused ATPase/permease subunit
MHIGSRGAGSREREPDTDRRVAALPLVLRMWRQFGRPYWLLTLAIAVTLAATGLVNAYSVQPIRFGVNEALRLRGGNPSHLLNLGVQFLVLSLLGSLLSLLGRLWTNRLQTGLSYDLRGRVYDHIQRLSLSYYESASTGDVMSRAVGDANAVAERLMAPLIFMGSLASRFLFTLYFVLQMNATLALLALVGVPFALVAMYQLGHTMRQAWRRFREADASVWSMLAENIAGMAEIKAFAREGQESARFEARSADLRGHDQRSRDLGAGMGFAIHALFIVGNAIVLFKGSYDVYRGVMEPGDLTAFFVYLGMLISPILEVGFMYADLQRSAVSAQRVFEVLDTQTTVTESPDARDLGPVEASVSFEGVSFRYGEDADGVLHEINLTIAPGETVALVGPSGGGKTTLSKLAPRKIGRAHV